MNKSEIKSESIVTDIYPDKLYFIDPSPQLTYAAQMLLLKADEERRKIARESKIRRKIKSIKQYDPRK